ncbi:MAG: transposase [Pirellulales bacterium]|nr:transposase [Pirellulales bacterium]
MALRCGDEQLGWFVTQEATISRRKRKTVYWQDALLPREQMLLIPSTLEETIPADHPVRKIDELLSRMDWSEWEPHHHGSLGQPPIHPSVLSKVLLFAMIRRIRSSRRIEYALKHSIDSMWLSSGRRATSRWLKPWSTTMQAADRRNSRS